MNTFHKFETKVHCCCLIVSNANLSSALKIPYMYLGAHYCLVYLLIYSGICSWYYKWLLDLCCHVAMSFGNHMVRTWSLYVSDALSLALLVVNHRVTTCSMLPLYSYCLSLPFMFLVFGKCYWLWYTCLWYVFTGSIVYNTFNTESPSLVDVIYFPWLFRFI
jgi:hypothetical protein